MVFCIFFLFSCFVFSFFYVLFPFWTKLLKAKIRKQLSVEASFCFFFDKAEETELFSPWKKFISKVFFGKLKQLSELEQKDNFFHAITEGLFTLTGTSVRKTLLPVLVLSLSGKKENFYLSLLQEMYFSSYFFFSGVHELIHSFELEEYKNSLLSIKKEQIKVKYKEHISYRLHGEQEKIKTRAFILSDTPEKEYFKKSLCYSFSNRFIELTRPPSLAICTEKSYFFYGSFEKQLAYPEKRLSPSQKEKAKQLLDRFNLSLLKSNLSSKQQKFWREILSVGQRARLALIRLLLKDLDYFILENTLDVLDYKNTTTILEYFKESSELRYLIFSSKKLSF